MTAALQIRPCPSLRADVLTGGADCSTNAEAPARFDTGIGLSRARARGLAAGDEHRMTDENETESAKSRQGRAAARASIGKRDGGRDNRDAHPGRDRRPLDLVSGAARAPHRPGRSGRDPHRHRRASGRAGRQASRGARPKCRSRTIAVRDRQSGAHHQMAPVPGRRRRRKGPARQHSRGHAPGSHRSEESRSRERPVQLHPRQPHF